MPHFGAYNGHSMTYQEIADVFGVHHSRIQQIERIALNKLRRNAKAWELFCSLLERRSPYIGTLYRDEQGVEV